MRHSGSSFVPRTSYLILLLFFSNLLSAQTPVQVTPQLLPPYSLQVSEYYSGVQPKLQVLLLNRDINQPTIQVKLKLTVESQNCRMQTKANAITPTFTLTSGIPYYMTPQDLQPFFAAYNIDFGGGYSEQEYVQTGRLPEGLYSFYIEAFELLSGNLVSNKGFTLGWLTLADPPFLNTPARAEGVTPANPQNVIFNWTPRHNTSPTAGYYTDYIFTLVEYNDINIGPEASFTSSPPFFIDSTQTTTYLFGPGQPQLISGKRYAWRVQAKAKNGAQEIAMFRNNGFSEVFWFTYQNNCLAPLGINSTVQGQRATIEWSNNPQHMEWKVEYREKNNPDAQWFTIGNTLPRVMLTDLKPGTQYEYRVGGSCIVGQFTYSGLYTFTTGGSPVPPVPNCGDSTLPAQGSGQLLQTLNAGDTIRAGSFTVHVGYSAGAGSFTGMGYVIVPWLMNAKVEVRFTNITLSLDHKLLSGIIETTYDPNESGIADIDEYIDIFTAGQVGTMITGMVTADTTLGFPILWPGGIVATLPAGYNPATGQPASGTTIPITITNAQTGAQTTLQVSQLPTTIMDANGNVYQVATNGSVSLVAQSGGAELLQNMNKKVIDGDKALVIFGATPTAKYAFDKWQPIYKKSSTFNKEYEKIPCVNGGLSIDQGNYYVSAKAMAPGAMDTLIAIIRKPAGSTINKDSIQFVNSKGTKYTRVIINDSTVAIPVVGGPEKDAQEIYAVYKQTGAKNLNLGKVLVASYPRKEYNVVIVPQSGLVFNISGLQDSIRTIFNKYNVQLNVSIGNSLPNNSWDADNSTTLDVGSTGLISSYTDEMKNVINLFKSNNSSIDNNTVYLFYIDKPSVTGRLGDMPFGKQYGFVFKSNNVSEVIWSITHELGHGIFKLKHSFDYSGLIKGELADNLMDYTQGRGLCKLQWDLLHDQGLLTGLFAKDEATQGINFGISALNKPEFINPSPPSSFPFTYYTFISPTGKPISIPISGLSQVTFSTCDKIEKASDGTLVGFVPIGTLSGFVYEEKKYEYKGSWGNGYNNGPIVINNFNGYYNSDSKQYYYDQVLKHYSQINQNITNYGTNCITALGYWDKTSACVKYSVFRVNQNYTLTNEEQQNKATYSASGRVGQENNVFGVNDLFLFAPPPSGNYSNYQNGLDFTSSLQLSERSKDFCISLADYAAKGMYAAPLVIAHAQKITEYPESEICMQRDEADRFFDDLFYQPNFFLAKNIPPPTIEQANNLFVQNQAKINYDRIAQNQLKKYPEIADGVTSLQKAIKDNKSEDELADIIEPISICGLSQLNTGEIIFLIRKMTFSPLEDNQREAVLKLLNAAIQGGQHEKIMGLFEGEHKMVFERLFKIFEDKSDTDFRELIYLTFSIYKVVYPNNGVPYPYALNSNAPELIRMTTKNDPVYSEFGSITTNQYANGGDYHAIIHRLTRTGGYYSPITYDFFREIALDFYTDGDDCIYISDEFKNKRVSVPGFFAAYLIHEYKRGQDWRFVRKLIDGGIIVITVASGGTGSILGLIDIGFASADIFIQNNYDAINNNTNLSGFYTVFENVYNCYIAARAIQSIPDIIRFSETVVMNGVSYAKKILIDFEQLISKFPTLTDVQQQVIIKAIRLSRDMILRFSYFSKQALNEASFTARLLKRLEGKLIEKSFEPIAGRNVTITFEQGQGLRVTEGNVSSIIGDIGLDSKGGFIAESSIYESGSLEYVAKLKGSRYKVNGIIKDGEVLIYKNGNKFVTNLSGIFRKSYFENVIGFSDNISSLSSQQGISLSTFKVLQEKPASALSASELSTVNNIRNSISQPNSNTIMQKVIPKADIPNYLNGTPKVKGYVTTATDAKHLKTYDDIYNGMRLDYEGTKFSLSDGSCGVIKFKANNSGSAIVPKSPVNGGNVLDGSPFTGHGFTAAKSERLAVPEWKMMNEADMLDGAELWEVFSDGTEKLRGIYSRTSGKFISIN